MENTFFNVRDVRNIGDIGNIGDVRNIGDVGNIRDVRNIRNVRNIRHFVFLVLKKSSDEYAAGRGANRA